MAMLMTDLPATAKDEPPYPYKHIIDLPPSTPTAFHTYHPNMVVIDVEAAFMDPAPLEVTALADSGASHVLFKASAVHVLRNVEYSRPHDAPFAVLKAANHGVLTAIGRGILAISNVEIMAYIFPDRDLTSNLLGFLPFANMGCTTVFKPRSFHIFKGHSRTAILSRTRPDANSLWRVPIHSDGGDATDGIPPPAPWSRPLH
jgi:hypothetical protein